MVQNRNGHTGHTFPPDYAKRIGAAFVRIDASLCDALHYLEPVTHGSPFASRIADGVPVQYQLLLGQLEQVRDAMHTITERHRIPLPAPTASAIESCRRRISEAMLAIADLEPRADAHAPTPSDAALPGELEEDACRLVSHLMTLLDGLQTSLARDVDNTSHAPSEPPMESRQRAGSCAAAPSLVADLERITATHELGDLHRRTVEFAHHATVSDTVVAVFGTIGAGKSSLLNSLIGTPLLPVNALPTTAIPVRIRHGQVDMGTVEFVAAKAERFDRSRVSEFVDAHFNPANVRGVTGLVFDTPSPLLARGVTLIDTPGIDWETWDAAQTSLQATPWCDLAIVLISAAAPLTLREASLARQLCGRGARVAVLITKIDLIEPEDRWRIYEHVVRGLWKQTHLDVPAYLVSTREEEPPWRDAWIDGPFADALAQCREQRTDMRRRQLATLRRDVADALRIRLLWHASAAEPTEQMLGAVDALIRSREAIDTTLRAPADAAIALQKTIAALVGEIAHNAAALWSETHDPSFDATRLVELAANARALSIAGAARRTVETLQAHANVALHQAADALALARLAPALAPADSPPAFVVDASLPATPIPRASAWVFGRMGFYLSARKCLLHSASMRVVEHALLEHIENVEAWKQRSLATLSQGLSEHIDRLRSAGQRNDPVAREAVERLRADIARLRAAESSTPPGNDARK